MKTNLDNELYYDVSDIGNIIIQKIDQSPLFKIKYNVHSLGGIIKYDDISFNKSGFYFIYKNDILCYIGYTTQPINTRINRFIKEIFGNSHPKETHCAAKKYKQLFDTNMDGIAIKFIESSYIKNIIPKYIAHTDVEDYMIQHYNPLFNVKGNNFTMDASKRKQIDESFFYYKGSTLEQFI